MNFDSRTNGHESYHHLRSLLAPEYADLPAEEIEQIVAEQLPGVNAIELEEGLKSFVRNLGPALSQVGNVVQRAAPGAIQGAIQGASMGSVAGPYGMLAGALGGAALGGYQSYSASQQPQQQAPTQAQPTQPQARPTTTQMQPAQPRVTQAPAAPVRPAAPLPRPQAHAAPQSAQSNAAVAQLIGILSRPEVWQALLSQALGAAGRTSTAVGANQVQNAQMTGAIARLAERATLEATEADFNFAGGAEAVSHSMSDAATDDLLTRFAESIPPVAPAENLQSAIDDLVLATDRSFELTSARDAESAPANYTEYDDSPDEFNEWMELYVLSGDAESDDMLYDEEDDLFDEVDELEDYWWDDDYD